MLKFSTYTGIWILTILLLIAPIIKTEKYNIVDTEFSTCHYHNYYYSQNCGSLKNSNYFFLSFTHVVQDFISVLLNGTYIYDPLLITNRFDGNNNSKSTINDIKKLQKLLKNKLKNIPIYSKRLLMPSASKDTINHYTNDTLLSFNNALSKSTKGNNKYPKYQIGYRWKRRTLCAIFNREKYSTEKLKNKEEKGKRKTLLDYDEPRIFTNDIDDSDSLKAHVRVKRSKSESEPIIYRQDYLKDLANSFPHDQDIHESIGKNSYNDDATLLDTKREINYIGIDEHRKENEDRSKYLNAVISVYEDKFKNNNIIDSSSFDVTKVNALEKRNIKFVDETPDKEIKTLQKLSLNNMLNTNRQSEENSEVENLSDPMLAVELVRKKRNDYKANDDEDDKDNKEYLRGKNSLSFDSQNIEINEKEKSKEKKRSILETSILDKNLNPSDLINDMNTNLPRKKKRKEKDNYDGTKTKLKRKKKKHMGKKHDGSNNFLRPIKDVHPKDISRSKVSRKKKTNKGKNKDKLKKERNINAIDKKSNENNFHHRFVKSKNLVDRRDIFKNIELLPVHEKLKTSDKNKINDDMLRYVSSISSVAPKRPIEETKNSDDNSNTGIDENTNAKRMMQKRNEERKSFVENEENLPPQDTKLRIKRDKNTESNHGFLNKEEELKYYENIREPSSEINRCSNRDKNQLSMVNEMNNNNNNNNNRAVRSIQEVKELAKKLVTKVDINIYHIIYINVFFFSFLIIL